MWLPLIALIVVAIISSLVSNLPALVTPRPGNRLPLNDRRLLMLLGGQAVLFAVYAAALAFLQYQKRIETLGEAALLGGLLGLVPMLITASRSRSDVGRSVVLGLTILAASVATIAIAPHLWAR